MTKGGGYNVLIRPTDILLGRFCLVWWCLFFFGQRNRMLWNCSYEGHLCRCVYSHKFWFNLFSRSVSEIKYTCTTETVCHRNFSLNRNSCIFVIKVDILCRCAYSQEIPNGEHDTMTKTYNWITTCVKLVSQIHIIYMSEKLFGYNLQWTLQLLVDYVYLIITDIRIWFSVRLPITNAC